MVAKIVPLMSIIVMRIQICTLELSSHVIAFHQVLIWYGAWVAESKRVVFDSMLQWAPDTAW